jgi:hypothetical protein
MLHPRRFRRIHHRLRHRSGHAADLYYRVGLFRHLNVIGHDGNRVTLPAQRRALIIRDIEFAAAVRPRLAIPPGAALLNEHPDSHRKIPS